MLRRGIPEALLLMVTKVLAPDKQVAAEEEMDIDVAQVVRWVLFLALEEAIEPLMATEAL